MDSFAVEAKLFLIMARTKDFDENEVLMKAMFLFWSRGYNSTSMVDLVGGLGISRSSLYGTYTDKHTLFMKALEHYRQFNNVKIQEILNGQGSAKETVKKLIEYAIISVLEGRKGMGCFMVNAEVEVAPHDKKVNNLVSRNGQQMEDILYQVIQKGKKAGEIKSRSDARALARFISNSVKGMQISSKTNSDKSVFKDIVELTLSVLD